MTPDQALAAGLRDALSLLGRWDRGFRFVPLRRRFWRRPATCAQLNYLSACLHGNRPPEEMPR